MKIQVFELLSLAKLFLHFQLLALPASLAGLKLRNPNFIHFYLLPQVCD